MVETFPPQQSPSPTHPIASPLQPCCCSPVLANLVPPIPHPSRPPEGFQVANKLNRFALGDRDPLKAAPDGSVTLYIQPDSLGPDKEANWLPAPAKGPLGVTMRLYAPSAAIVEGSWVPPPVVKVA